MYGTYAIPVSIKDDSFTLSVEKTDGIFRYIRETGQEKIDKTVLARDCSLLVNPVEPLHTPKDLTPYLLIEFEKKLIIEPKGTSRVYIKFPAEIGIYAGKPGKSTKDFRIIDIFSLYPGKYTLYGDIRTGILCKYYKSDVYQTTPSVLPFIEGILELNIANRSERWAEVSRAVFNAFLMKIHYNKGKIGMKASMVLLDKDIAETSFSDSPLEKGMKKAVEYYVSKGIIMTSSTFVMEWGYDSQ